MTKNGKGILVILAALWVAAEVFDHSTVPMIFMISNIYEIVIAAAGVYKLLELIAKG